VGEEEEDQEEEEEVVVVVVEEEFLIDKQRMNVGRQVQHELIALPRGSRAQHRQRVPYPHGLVSYWDTKGGR
jgi:hypothetical protein